MKGLVVIFLIVVLVSASVPAFAKTWKVEKPEDSPFNVMKNWLSRFGEGSEGKSIMDPEAWKSSYNADKIKERRKSMGVKRGMKRYE